VARRVPLPGRHVQGSPHVPARRSDLSTPRRARRDRRRDVDMDPGTQDPGARRPLHLGRAERRQPAEGAALLRRMGGRPSHHVRARRRDDASRTRHPIFGRSASSRRSATRPSCWSPSRNRRSR
jgi:hypothetical protein